MQMKMRFQKKREPPKLNTDSVSIELRGTPVLVEYLKQLIIDHMKKQEGFDDYY